MSQIASPIKTLIFFFLRQICNRGPSSQILHTLVFEKLTITSATPSSTPCPASSFLRAPGKGTTAQEKGAKGIETPRRQQHRGANRTASPEGRADGGGTHWPQGQPVFAPGLHVPSLPEGHLTSPAAHPAARSSGDSPLRGLPLLPGHLPCALRGPGPTC